MIDSLLGEPNDLLIFGNINKFMHSSNIDYREIDGAIMDFQLHVRKVTGGNDRATVDSTDLKAAINNTLSSQITKAKLEVLEDTRKIIVDRKECYEPAYENADEAITDFSDELLVILDEQIKKLKL